MAGLDLTSLRRWLPRRSDLATARIDLAALLAGYCNAHSTNGSRRDGGGGYTFWRCRRRRGHTGAHRMFNYRWTTQPGMCVYDPIERAEQRAAAVAADTVDAVPLPSRRLEIHHATWPQRVRSNLHLRRLMRDRAART